MKTAIKFLLLLAVFIAAKEGFKFIGDRALTAYGMSLGHCGCTKPFFWLLWLVGGYDFFTHWPLPVLSDLLWGSLGAAVTLWAEKRRNARRTLGRFPVQAKAGVWPPPVATPPL